jgi:hypothetical protein
LAPSNAATAALMAAYLAKGIAIHQSTAGLEWSDDAKSLLQIRLGLAESTFSDAERQLATLKDNNTGYVIAEKPARSVAALVDRLEGTLMYRRWMIVAHRRIKSAVTTVAVGHDGELNHLAEADARFNSSAAVEALPFDEMMTWGNVLRAQGRYDDAVVRYRKSADLDPSNHGPLLNIAVTYLDRVGFGDKPVDRLQVLVALGALTDYLAWTSDGGPYDSLEGKAAEVVDRAGDPDTKADFTECMTARPTDVGPKWQRTAAFKVCIDNATKRISNMVR